ncbi:hypothetical protein PICMEDRAFT_17752 [Pichia membranifaciens NRRL Y-2026]|uniref:Uncharacterized protein n=1 Tax=Pichia membranifaciens NRRL Y-2026 TaxID=763406 RepID=A0A1E3NGQ7_9ASCO|nr:hypothetical protein PICMEDRAFT_17752 [Pichia membranifaciens NRRL Y-2026]ODQ45266.1 hypothetical protein PICMEDRAFT_17752 [Pichia membranifaciens NRRL Y-2026]
MKFSQSLSLLALSALASAAPVAVNHQHHMHKRDEYAAPSTSASGPAPSSSGSSSGSFEDGTIPCSQFPSVDGIVSVDWIGLGGWASVMGLDGSTSNSCSEGFYCSYACEPGMSKTQWPSNQPSDGRTVGGLLCKGGFLYKSNSDADSLCQADHSTGYVKSELSDSVALCRTDYPGSENMVVPTELQGGATQPLSVVDEDSYFKWGGKKTSSQYYVNNAGVSVEDGCVWGTSSAGVGNYAPIVIGAGSTGGLTYLSLIPNPNNGNGANYNIKIEATEGSSINGDCYYENGSFSSADGCTVTVTSGSANVIFY